MAAGLQGVQRIRVIQRVQPLHALPVDNKQVGQKECLQVNNMVKRVMVCYDEGSQPQLLTEDPRRPAGPAGPKEPLSPWRREHQLSVVPSIYPSIHYHPSINSYTHEKSSASISVYLKRTLLSICTVEGLTVVEKRVNLKTQSANEYENLI